ncbi:MAG TPA: hypothetical protein VG899_12410 [Mycobacteriales bacterium]|nr:hypothetical protein [Mycobacteriales bacterium]
MGVYVRRGLKRPLVDPRHGGKIVPRPDREYDENDPLVLAHPRCFAPRPVKKPRGK